MKSALLTIPMRYIAFLRAINAGGHMVKMDRLRVLFEALKLRNVETFIASGNVIFETSSVDEEALTSRVEKHLEKSLGYAVATFLRTPEELQAIADRRPFSDAELDGPRHGLYVGLLRSNPTRASHDKVMALSTPTDDFRVAGRELYWLIRTLSSESKVSGAYFEKALGGPVTLRNINTIRRLVAKYPPAR